MIKYQGELKNYPFKSIRQHYPALQKRVYDALLALTPSQLQFEFDAIPDKEEHIFSFDGVDQDTYEIIGTVMSSVMDENRLILTRDDVTIIYLRFRELMFLYEAVRQGIMVSKLTDTDTDYFFDIETEPENSGDQRPRIYRTSIRRYR
jgi:hypothetical protein